MTRRTCRRATRFVQPSCEGEATRWHLYAGDGTHCCPLPAARCPSPPPPHPVNPTQPTPPTHPHPSTCSETLSIIVIFSPLPHPASSTCHDERTDQQPIAAVPSGAAARLRPPRLSIRTGGGGGGGSVAPLVATAKPLHRRRRWRRRVAGVGAVAFPLVQDGGGCHRDKDRERVAVAPPLAPELHPNAP